ncbi:MAG TPA: hypothetical protein VNK82_05880 [Terriglobales bacterium]|nr:hypothetical protein [Terriglobales bacterium]
MTVRFADFLARILERLNHERPADNNHSWTTCPHCSAVIEFVMADLIETSGFRPSDEVDAILATGVVPQLSPAEIPVFSERVSEAIVNDVERFAATEVTIPCTACGQTFTRALGELRRPTLA